MRLSELTEGTLKIETVRIAQGCPEACSHCGAYEDGFEKDDLKVSEATPEQISAALLKEVLLKGGAVDEGREAVRLRIADLLANLVTTDVNSEPLRGDGFLTFAKLVKELTDRKSRVVCISHGLRAEANGKVNKHMECRLKQIVAQMDEQDSFVLSLDLARSRGKLGHEVNVSSYVETLERMKPALLKGSRITVSVQGVDESTLPDGNPNPLSREASFNVWTEVKRELTRRGWLSAEIMKIVVDDTRAMVRAGRAKNLPGVNPAGECAVIPDQGLVLHTLDKGHGIRGRLDCFTGEISGQANNPRSSYNDTVDRARWEKIDVNGGGQCGEVMRMDGVLSVPLGELSIGKPRTTSL